MLSDSNHTYTRLNNYTKTDVTDVGLLYETAVFQKRTTKNTSLSQPLLYCCCFGLYKRGQESEIYYFTTKVGIEIP